IFVGLSANEKEPVSGVSDAAGLAAEIQEDVARHVTPPISVSTDIGMTDGKAIVIVTVPAGVEKPYAVAPGNIYVRQEGETALALRDEIVELVKAGLHAEHGLMPVYSGDGPDKRSDGRNKRERSEAIAQPAAAPEKDVTADGQPLP